MPKATRAQHYRAIAEFYGRMLLEDIKDPSIPDFVLAHSARRASHFALAALRLTDRPRGRSEAWRRSSADVDSISTANPS